MLDGKASDFHSWELEQSNKINADTAALEQKRVTLAAKMAEWKRIRAIVDERTSGWSP